jgi:CheY-like chemotaxis protein
VSQARRILLVDDDLRVHELLRWTLRPPRFELDSFSDPRRALDALPGLAPDLIICDMIMPSMDGQVFLSLVKRMPELSRTPFLFLTAVRSSSEVQAAFEGGADAYLVKPFPLSKLVEAVDRMLGTAPGERPSAPDPLARRAGAGGGPAATADASPASPQGRAAPAEAPTGQDGTLSGATPAKPVPERRVSTFERDGAMIVVMTKSESRPDLVITTIVSIASQVVRKIESLWSHPFRRRQDAELVRRQADLQHERAVADGHSEPLFGTRRGKVWSKMARLVRR